MKIVFTISIIVYLHASMFAQISETEITSNGVCFPQLTTAERNLISPISGQCIFNTDAVFLECYLDQDQGWKSMQSLLSDEDGDTQILVERVPDEDIIYLIGEGQSLLTVRATDYGDARLEPSAFGFDSGYRANVFFGAETGHEITTGIQNVIIGTESAVPLTTGNSNTTLGFRSGAYMTDGSLNTFLGAKSGFNTSSGHSNTYIGQAAGELTETGNFNTNIGARTDGPVFGSGNVFLGAQAGEEIKNANKNVYIGFGSGSDADGDHNVFIGNNSGGNFNTSAKLIIESHPPGPWTSHESSLIYGDFESDFVTINSTLNVSKILKLQPLEIEPVCDEEAYGSIYMDAVTDRVRLCTSLGWKSIALEP